MRAESPPVRLTGMICCRFGVIASLQAADSFYSGFPALRTGLWDERAFGASKNVYTRQPDGLGCWIAAPLVLENGQTPGMGRMPMPLILTATGTPAVRPYRVLRGGDAL